LDPTFVCLKRLTGLGWMLLTLLDAAAPAGLRGPHTVHINIFLRFLFIYYPALSSPVSYTNSFPAIGRRQSSLCRQCRPPLPSPRYRQSSPAPLFSPVPAIATHPLLSPQTTLHLPVPSTACPSLYQRRSHAHPYLSLRRSPSHHCLST
jgi:hypothetical protein